MKPGQTCNTCNAWCALDNTCRAGPPKVFPMMQKNGGVAGLTFYPQVSGEHWCRGWAPDITVQ